MPVGTAYVETFRRFNVVGGLDCLASVKSDDDHCDSFGCVVACENVLYYIIVICQPASPSIRQRILNFLNVSVSRYVVRVYASRGGPG